MTQLVNTKSQESDDWQPSLWLEVSVLRVPFRSAHEVCSPVSLSVCVHMCVSVLVSEAVG